MYVARQLIIFMLQFLAQCLMTMLWYVLWTVSATVHTVKWLDYCNSLLLTCVDWLWWTQYDSQCVWHTTTTHQLSADPPLHTHTHTHTHTHWPMTIVHTLTNDHCTHTHTYSHAYSLTTVHTLNNDHCTPHKVSPLWALWEKNPELWPIMQLLRSSFDESWPNLAHWSRPKVHAYVPNFI